MILESTLLSEVLLDFLTTVVNGGTLHVSFSLFVMDFLSLEPKGLK